MKFSETLNNLLSRLSCTAKELCAASGLSEATLSRYRSGERLPQPGSESFENLCRALIRLAGQKDPAELTPDQIRAALLASEDLPSQDREVLRQNLNALIAALNLNLTRLCRGINYDSSALFRIRNGSRLPADSGQFAASVASFVAREAKTPAERAALAELIGAEASELEDLSVRYSRLLSWLLDRQPEKEEGGRVAGFLNRLDEFDLNEYIKAIHFDELKVPSVPFQIPSSRAYFGLSEMMESELDFLKATVLSKSTAPVTMYSDMPLQEMAKDPDFPKKWMFGMAMLLKKGLHLNQIHNLDRSFEDMMLGLESWIPMYMTGQISPYYLKSETNRVFLHLLKVSGAAALTGEAVAGYQSEGRYYLTKSRKEMEYYQKRADELLSCASPLMEIYKSERAKEHGAFLLADASLPGRRRSILSTPPLYTMGEELLTRILDRQNLPEEERAAIRKAAGDQRARVERILETETVWDEVADLTEEEFAAHPVSLDLAETFYETDLPYRYEEYLAHWEQTEAFAAAHPNYSVQRTRSQAFRNLQIRMHEEQWAMVSKSKAPAIHFVIRHPKLRRAIESFIPPVVE